MAQSYLDKDGLLYFLQQIRPNATPQMDGTASTGTAKRFANQDHVHPSDTTKADKSATVTNVAWDSTNNKITKTINGTTSDIVTTSTLKTAIGSATTSNEGLMTTTQVTKLNGIETGAEVNQNAFSNVKVGSTNVVADTTSDTLELVAGSNVTLTPDATNDKVTIAATDTTYSDATQSTHGLMSSSDKTKLDGIASGAEVNVQSDWNETDSTSDAYIANKPTIPTVPSYLSSYGQIYGECTTAATTVAKVVSSSSYNLRAYGIVAVYFSNGSTRIQTLNVNSKGAKTVKYRNTEATSSTPLTMNIPSGYVAYFMYDGECYCLLNWQHAEATTSVAGYMSSSDKTKLNGIETGAEVNQNAFSNVKVDSTTIAADTKTDTLELVAGSNVTLTPDATNDKVTIAATDTTYSDATTSAHGLMSASDKIKLDNISGSVLNLTAGSNITITPNTGSGSITIAATNTTYSAGTASILNTGTDTSNRVWQAKILADYVNGQIATAITGAVAYQGIAPTTFAPTNYQAGWYWIIGTAGTYVGQVCEAGDMIFCKAGGASYSASDFDVVQTNLDITAITNAEIDVIVAS